MAYDKKAITKYFSSQKGRAAKRRAGKSYDGSEAGLARRKRYRQNQSEEQKEKQRQRMRDYRARKKQERALNTDDIPTVGGTDPSAAVGSLPEVPTPTRKRRVAARAV